MTAIVRAPRVPVRPPGAMRFPVRSRRRGVRSGRRPTGAPVEDGPAPALARSGGERDVALQLGRVLATARACWGRRSTSPAGASAARDSRERLESIRSCVARRVARSSRRRVRKDPCGANVASRRPTALPRSRSSEVISRLPGSATRRALNRCHDIRCPSAERARRTPHASRSPSGVFHPVNAERDRGSARGHACEPEDTSQGSNMVRPISKRGSSRPSLRALRSRRRRASPTEHRETRGYEVMVPAGRSSSRETRAPRNETGVGQCGT